jgi:hypothetical protein
VRTPAGDYALTCDYSLPPTVIAVRQMLGLDFEGRIRGSLPHRRREDEGGLPPSGDSGSIAIQSADLAPAQAGG